MTTTFLKYARYGDDCWEWTGGKSSAGYGNYKNRPAHRVFYEWYHGGLPPHPLVLDHICRNRACVRPDHLRAVTQRQNVVENSDSFVAANALKTHCPQGHPYDGENLRVKGTRRLCKACAKTARLIYHATPEYKARHAAEEREARRLGKRRPRR